MFTILNFFVTRSKIIVLAFEVLKMILHVIRRGIKKRVVEIPMKDVEGTNTPPSDSWAWRKYGQKPIKGSPYPRYSII